MTFDTQSSSTTILPPRKATTLPSTTPSEVIRLANRKGGSANEIVQSAIAGSGGAIVPLANFTQGTGNAPMLDTGSQTGTIAVVDDTVSPEVNAQVIPFADYAKRRLAGTPQVPMNAVAAGPEDMMPLVSDGPMGAAETEAKANPWPWIIAGGAILAMLWKFSQDSDLQGAPLVADLEGVDDDDGGDDSADEHEPEGSKE